MDNQLSHGALSTQVAKHLKHINKGKKGQGQKMGQFGQKLDSIQAIPGSLIN